MGGRGASSGTSIRGNEYGSQWETVEHEGNIKIIKAKDGVQQPETPVETRTKGRIYGVINSKGNLGSIITFDKSNKEAKEISLDHSHSKLKPHVHTGYLHSGDKTEGVRPPNESEMKLIQKVEKIWNNHKNK